MPTATALRCFIAALEEQSEDGKPVGGGPTQVNALWRDRTAYRSSACPTS